jgi:hypothetical protein
VGDSLSRPHGRSALGANVSKGPDARRWATTSCSHHCGHREAQVRCSVAWSLWLPVVAQERVDMLRGVGHRAQWKSATTNLTGHRSSVLRTTLESPAVTCFTPSGSSTSAMAKFAGYAPRARAS